MPYKTFGFSEQQILVRDQVLKLLQRVAPDEKLDAWERASAYPEEAYQALAAEGYLALPFAEEFGGGNAGHRSRRIHRGTRLSPSRHRLGLHDDDHLWRDVHPVSRHAGAEA
jgi:alkylation response protein AidB-like acyl-CoA dehydrogenase